MDYNKFAHIIDVWNKGDYEQAGLEASGVVYDNPDEPDEDARTKFIADAPGIEAYIRPEKKPGKVERQTHYMGQSAPMAKEPKSVDKGDQSGKK